MVLLPSPPISPEEVLRLEMYTILSGLLCGIVIEWSTKWGCTVDMGTAMSKTPVPTEVAKSSAGPCVDVNRVSRKCPP